MLLAHAVTLAEARSYLAALADQALTFDASIEYERILLQVDFIHRDFIPGITHVPAYSRDVLFDVAYAGHRGARRARRRPALRRTVARHAGGGLGEGLALMYGENSGHLRHALGVLAREHRIQQRLGGKGTHTVPETTTSRNEENWASRSAATGSAS